MAVARVVVFDGVTADRIAQVERQITDEPAPEGMPASEIVVLHDPKTDKSLTIVFFETDDDYVRGDAILSAMPSGDTPGQRTSVTKYNVAVRRAI